MEKKYFPRKIKILIGLSQLGIGGLELQALELCNGLDKNKYEIECIPLWSILNLQNEFENAGVKIVNIHKKRSVDIFMFIKLIQYLKKNNFDIVHTWIFSSNTWTRLAAVLAKVPIIIASERNVDDWKKPHHIFIDKLLAKYSDVVIVNSKAVKNFVENEGIPSNKCILINNGLDFKKYSAINLNKNELLEQLNIPKGKVIIGVFANFRPEKDYSTFVTVANEISLSRDNVHFIACGDGVEFNIIKKLVIKQGLEKKISFLGLRRDLPTIMKCTDIFLSTSHREGMSNSILEAMASGLPVVVTNVGGNSEIVENRESGFLVPVGATCQIISAIEKLIDSPSLRKEMGEKGKQFVNNHFSLGAMINSYDDLYTSLFETKGNDVD
jgi:glycosyltransferase involved in cell wall biosynthesis